MAAPVQQESMLRKPILMPPGMIKKVDKISRDKKVSFAGESYGSRYSPYKRKTDSAGNPG